MADQSPDGTGVIHTRKLSPGLRVAITLVVGAISLGLLVWVAPPDKVVAQIGAMNIDWVLAGVALEIGSCLGYVFIFRRFFPEPPPGISRQVAWISMGAGAVLPGGNISSAAATGWLLRSHGIGVKRLLERCGSLLCLLTGFGFFVNGLCGVLLLIGVPGGPHDLLHTGGPILVSVCVLGGATLLVVGVRRWGAGAPLALRGIAAGLEGGWAAARTAHWRLLGGAAFLLLDMGALWAACQATGHPIGVPALIIAYCIGYLATMIPMPAGIGVLDTGLAGSLVLYGMHPAASVGAVLVYHAISIWVPGAGGLIAWLPTRAPRRAAAQRAAMRLPDLATIELGPLRLAEAADAE